MSCYDTYAVRRLVSRIPHLRLAVLAAVLGAAAGGAAWVLLHLIALFTNLFLFHRWGWHAAELQRAPAAARGSSSPRSPAAAVVTLLARWAPVIRGHGIPEAMEAVLVRQSRIAPRTAVAKPLSAAIAIGTGGPFGAEGPIIVTGGALGLAARPGPPRVGQRAQDPARQRRRGRHGGHVRHAAGRRRAGDRAAAVRVLDAGVRPAGGGDQRRRRRARRAVRHRARCSPCPPTTSPGSPSSRGSRCSASAAACWRRHRQGPVRRRARATAACRSARSWHPIIGAARVGADRPARAARARRRLRRHRRRPRRPARRRPRSPPSPSASSWSGGSRWRRAPRAARWRRSC